MPRKPPSVFRIGTAGWSLPSTAAGAFPVVGSHLERYSSIFDAAEILDKEVVAFIRDYVPWLVAQFRGR